MFKQRDFFSAFVFCCLGLLSAGTYASGRTDLAQVEVTGRVSFERRLTVVPLSRAFCLSPLKCGEQGIYWVMTIEDSDRKYVLEQPFAIGQDDQPEFVELSGVLLRQGTRVNILGHAVLSSDMTAILKQIDRLTLVMDLARGAGLASQGIRKELGADKGGFFCKNDRIAAKLFYRTDAVGPIFTLKLIDDSGASGLPRGIAEFGDIRGSLTDREILIEGDSDRSTVTLAIDRGTAADPQFIGRLQVRAKAAVPLVQETQLECRRLRWVGIQ